MGSRIKESPERTFELFIEASCPKSSDVDPEVLRQFPEDYNDQESLQSLPKFCFPFDVERVWESSVVQQFTFVLTDLNGNQRFGFCRLTGGSKTCVCILSFLPWFEVFYKLLNNIADCLAKGQDNEVKELLRILYIHPPPQPDSPLKLELAQKLGVTTGRFLKDQKRDPSSGMLSLSYFIAPDSNSLPTIPESRNLTEYVVAVDVNNMLHLYASMLHERRIIITCSKLSTLTACVHGSTSMLYPMYWQHIYIPVLPPHLLDYCCAPMPYVIGIHSSLMEKVRSRALEDVVILNVDSNTLESPFNDLDKLPPDVVSVLKMKLKKQSAVTGDVVARAFLRAQAAIFGSYQDALKFNSDEPVTFCEEIFLNHKPAWMKDFLQHAVHLQLFKQVRLGFRRLRLRTYFFNQDSRPSNSDGVGLSDNEDVGPSGGDGVGLSDGDGVGLSDDDGVGLSSGDSVGQSVGDGDGRSDSDGVGLSDSDSIGLSDSDSVGLSDGDGVGLSDGDGVGLSDDDGVGLCDSVGMSGGDSGGLSGGVGLFDGNGVGLTVLNILMVVDCLMVMVLDFLALLDCLMVTVMDCLTVIVFLSDRDGVGLSDGDSVGLSDGDGVGLSDGDGVGLSDDDSVGLSDSDGVGLSDGDCVGLSDGDGVGLSDSDGLSDGDGVGLSDGDGLSDGVGLSDGDGDGDGDGVGLSDSDGLSDGDGVGLSDGDGLSDGVGLSDGDGDGVGLSNGDGVGLSDGDGVGLDGVGLCDVVIFFLCLQKGGGALIHTVRSKTNPAMKNMYKYAKGQAKLGLKDLKSRLKHKELSVERGVQRGGSLRCESIGGSSHQRRMQSESLQNRLPITQHFGQSRPRRPAPRSTNADAALPPGRDRSNSRELGLESSLDTIEDELLDCNLLQDEDMDLLGEIFDTLSTRTVHDKGLLYGTRSLDFYNLDSMEDIRRVKDINPSDENLTSKSRRESVPAQPGSWGLDGSAECVKSLSASLDESSGLSSVSNSQPDLRDSGSLSSSSHEENIPAPKAETLKCNSLINNNTTDPGSTEEPSSNSLSGKANDKCTGIHWDKGSSLAQFDETLAENGDSQLEVSKIRGEVQTETVGLSELKLSEGELKQHRGQEAAGDHVENAVVSTEIIPDQTKNTEKLPPPTAPKTSTMGRRARLTAQANKGLDGSDTKGESSNGQEMGSKEPVSHTEFPLSAPAGMPTGGEETTPPIQSALSYFKARSGEQKADSVRGKVHQSPASAGGSLGRSGKAECKEDLNAGKAVSELTTSNNGSPGKSSPSPESEKQIPEPATPSDKDSDITPPKKVSELKKRFES
ncbi:uncharacterized protein LOC122552390 [Chiloscyllium plagiosum]|uniref:uncharacterized protein LOC122552390 n=1 Tax=Chiloscyllium plagiosum TaxID=36176 RepID=UPI001CB83DFA|nr:uncharacterized protein LOC122552390 [Chiloscyllium plagiosum]